MLPTTAQRKATPQPTRAIRERTHMNTRRGCSSKALRRFSQLPKNATCRRIVPRPRHHHHSRCRGDRGTGPAAWEFVYADLDIAAAHAQRRVFEPVDHYARPGVFTLHVDSRAKSPVVFRGETMP
jgi:hypothetical protein